MPRDESYNATTTSELPQQVQDENSSNCDIKDEREVLVDEIIDEFIKDKKLHIATPNSTLNWDYISNKEL